MDSINKLMKISEDDKNILRNALKENDINLCKEMSIFSKKGSYHKKNKYNYFETNNDEDIYFAGLYLGTDLGIFFDSEKKILFNSRYYFTCSFHHLLINIDKAINCLENINIDKAIDIGTSFVCIQKWFITYGHFKDELFCLADFIGDSNYKGIIEFHTNNNVFKHIKFNENYKKLASFIFPEGYINPYEYELNILKLKKLKLVEHNILSPMFHSFPKIVTNRIINNIENNKEINNIENNNIEINNIEINNIEINNIENNNIENNNIENNNIENNNTENNNIENNNIENNNIENNNIEIKVKYDKIFVTRGKAIHTNRNLNNQLDIENYFNNNGVYCCNPENITIEEFIITIKEYSNIIITWGSSLVNIIYLKPGSNVTILRSKSYVHESIELFRKIIDTYELNIKIIDSDINDNIDLNLLT